MVGLTNPPEADLKIVRVLIRNGVQDPLIPLAEGERVADIFRAAGANVIFEAQTATHALVQEDLEAASGWLAEVQSKRRKRGAGT